ncbi:MAG TPA: tripartite tricarboxylate transporter substrate binding protein [Burkholderiales bacterium]|jgi:tripartite-type tricarboxylate transporter receptor subunit TctC|nr:tripartite tricarboxylate transporter substrate binding protein [Burkholderiales bacterium]
MRLKILASLLALVSAVAQAQYPNKPVKLIVPFPPGGAAELGARIFAQPLGQALGQPVVIETRPGADGIIASEAVKQAAPDGYTLYYGTATGMSYVPAVKKVPPYDPVADFTPISMVGIFGFFVFSHPSVPAHTLAELIAYVRANPGKLNYGSGNATSILTTGQFAAQQKLDMLHVPYKGDGPLSTDILGGRVHLAFATPGILAPQVKEGKLRVLATLLPSRSPLLPEAPTFAEAGVAPVTVTPWGGLFGPPKLPKDIVERVGRELANVLARQEVKDAFGKLAFEPRSSTPQQLSAFVVEQLEAYRRVAKQVGLSQD